MREAPGPMSKKGGIHRRLWICRKCNYFLGDDETRKYGCMMFSDEMVYPYYRMTASEFEDNLVPVACCFLSEHEETNRKDRSQGKVISFLKRKWNNLLSRMMVK